MVRRIPYMTRPILKIGLLCLIISGFFSSLVIPAEDFNDLMKYRLKGKVRSVKETRYALSGKEKDSGKERIVYQKDMLFDEYGYETENYLYEGGKILLTSKFLFGNKGKQSEMNEYKPDGTFNLSVLYTYDDKGYRSEASYRWADDYELGEICENTDYYHEIIQNDIFTKVTYKNEYRGYCVQEDYLKFNGDLSFRITAKYDFRGNKTESAYFHGNERLSWITKNKYDRYDNLIESQVYKSNRIAVLSKYEYQFDDSGNWISRREYRDVHVNILTAGLDQADMLTERIIEYY